MDYKKCKFDPCMFRHVMKTDDVEIDALKKQNETLLQNI